jgi:hypothetical protein
VEAREGQECLTCADKLRRIAIGSLRNKLHSILPAALVLSEIAPLAVEIILMIGGTYLACESAQPRLRGMSRFRQSSLARSTSRLVGLVMTAIARWCSGSSLCRSEAIEGCQRDLVARNRLQ